MIWISDGTNLKVVVEDEPLIALAIVEDFKAAGASVHTAYNLSDGLRLADHPDLSSSCGGLRAK